MAYGTTNGVSNNLEGYADMITAGTITPQMVTDCRVFADSVIDSRLVRIVPKSDLPLVSPPAIINTISDDFTTYYLLRRVYVGKDKNESAWVDKFWTPDMELLEDLIKNGSGLLVDGSGNALSGSTPVSSTSGLDPIFGMERTSGGTEATSEYEESMEDWNE